MTEKTLSICVPTLGNKITELEIQLEQIEKMSAIPRWNIELCISVSRNFSRQFFDLGTHKLVNVARAGETASFPENLLTSINCASGEFILLLGDDDLIVPQELGKLILNLGNLCENFTLRFLEMMHSHTALVKRRSKKDFLSEAQVSMRGAALPGILFRTSDLDPSSIDEWVRVFPESIYPQIWLAFSALRKPNSRAISIPAVVKVRAGPVGGMGDENTNRMPHYGVVERLEQLSTLYSAGNFSLRERIRAEANLALWMSSALVQGSSNGS